tara:strand:- start:603 stop:863 length:261 start_codon:yes stop_codon:yes gene_type:complete
MTILRKLNQSFEMLSPDNHFYMSTPEAVVGVDTLGDFGQNILVRVWVQSDYMVSGKMQLFCEIQRVFYNENTTIPFPRYEVEHLSI